MKTKKRNISTQSVKSKLQLTNNQYQINCLILRRKYTIDFRKMDDPDSTFGSIMFAFESGMTSLPTLLQPKKSEVKSDFRCFHLIEFTGDQIKLEENRYESENKVEVISVCMAYHGGPLDHPKVTSKSIGDVVSKWDFCYENMKLSEKDENGSISINISSSQGKTNSGSARISN